ncbi:MAG: efflux RND transporter periplasmic adaptor subunit [Candidatus Obscuribacterales bacterium]|nr:efflux RND transporter periplasmic adaptor subunit [Candidatus Obscuribacterales bacterium]
MSCQAPAFKFLKFTAVFLLILLTCACSKEESGQDEKSAPSEKSTAPVEVRVVKVKKESVPIFAEWVGQTEASQTVNIRTRVDGTLESIGFQEGDYVNKGQMLFQIEKTSYLAALKSAQAELDKAKAQLAKAEQEHQTKEQSAQQSKYESALLRAEQDLSRIKALAQQGAISQHELDVAVDAAKQAKAQLESQKAVVSDAALNQKSSIETEKANLASAEAALTQAQLNLAYTTIRSPLRGIIGRNQLSPGNLLSKSENITLASISAVDPLKVSFSVSEAEYLKCAKEYAASGKVDDAPLELYLADNTVYPLKGKFHFLDRAVDSKTGTIAIEALFPNPKGILRPGQFTRVRSLFETKKNALLIPDECIQNLQGTSSVYVISPDQKALLRQVLVGTKLKNEVLIEAGLNEGETVVREGMQKLSPGQKVQIVDISKP